ncbi:3-hydroxyacyl-ACP dehydratase FabZ [Metabacillus halosaccharovorans]|uniref:3-hydroxyacyl-ACP dehydratase FabZ n=1 Tax=Metabacillus halosaccharovorans TaxID=930124 RepID=UPI0031F759AF
MITTTMQMDISEIKTRLRQRYPFLLVDRILEVEPLKRVVGYKNVSINEPYFVGHFPEEPIFPGVLIIESMAQVGAMMFGEKTEGYLAAVNKAKFIKFVKPGDRLQTEAEFIQQTKNYAKVNLTGTVDGIIVARAEVTYYFKLEE